MQHCSYYVHLLENRETENSSREQIFTKSTFSSADLQTVPIGGDSEPGDYGKLVMSEFSVQSFRRGLRCSPVGHSVTEVHCFREHSDDPLFCGLSK